MSADDVERAIGALATLGGGWRVESTGTASKSNGDSARRPNGAVKMVRSVPMELSDDVNAALAFAKDTPEGRATTAELAESLAWSRARAEDALEAAVKLGVALVDDQNNDPGHARLYWFPAFRADLYAG